MTDAVTDRPAATTIPLTAEDRAILRLEGPTVVGHIAKIVLLEGTPVSAADLRARLAERLPRAPELTYRLTSSADAPQWLRGADPDLTAQVRDAGTAADTAALTTRVAQLFATHLDRSRPLWAMDVVQRATGGTALVWRLHHALADGMTAVRLCRSALFDEPADESSVPAAPAPGADPRPAAPHRHQHQHQHQHQHGMVGLVGRELLHGGGHSPFDGAICDEREVGFAAVSLPRLRRAAAAVPGATVNDAVLALVAGALRWWAAAGHGRVCDVSVRIPVSLHRPGDTALNRDSWFDLELPVHVADPRARLAEIRRRTATRKAAGDALRLERLDHRLHVAAPPLARLYDRHTAAPGSFALSVSNVPGPSHPVSVLGRPVTQIVPLAEIGQRHGLRVCAFSTADTLSFGLTADPDIVPAVDVLAGGLPDALDELESAA